MRHAQWQAQLHAHVAADCLMRTQGTQSPENNHCTRNLLSDKLQKERNVFYDIEALPLTIFDFIITKLSEVDTHIL